MNKLILALIGLSLTLASTNAFACIGRLSKEEKKAIVAKMDLDLSRQKLYGATPVTSELLTEQVQVGTRGNCKAVTLIRFQKITYTTDWGTCQAYASSELMEGYYGVDTLKHIVANVSCVD